MNDPLKNNTSSKLLHNGGIVWLLPFLAIAYFDLSLAAFFVIPFILLALLYILIAKFINKFFPSQTALLNVSSLCGAIVLTIAILFFGFRQYSPTNLFESAVTKPIPESVEIIETDGQLSVFGISSFYITFNLSPSDFDIILKAKQFSKNDIENMKT